MREHSLYYIFNDLIKTYPVARYIKIYINKPCIEHKKYLITKTAEKGKDIFIYVKCGDSHEHLLAVVRL